MNLEQIKIKIGERVDDPNGVAYADRYEGLFISAMIDIIKSVDKEGNPLFSASEYPELVAPYNENISFVDGFAKVLYSAINAIFVRDVYSDPIMLNINNRINFKKRDLSDILSIQSNSYLYTRMSEGSLKRGYWAEKGDAVFILVDGATQDARVSFDRVKNPSASNWGTDDLISDLHYGIGFIEASIRRAADILRSEIRAE